MPTSVRLDPASEAILLDLAHLLGESKSEVIRRALRQLAEALPHPTEDRSGTAARKPSDAAP